MELSPNTPLCWLDPASTALYIRQAEQEYTKAFVNACFYKDWAEASFSLRAWEGLGSVLRIMPTPEQSRLVYFLAQFFSYFVSPNIELNSVSLQENEVILKTSIPEQGFPEIAKYLSACVTYIPCFTKNRNMTCSWQGDLFKIHFFNQQESIFDTSTTRTHITPELMNSLLEDFKKKEELLILREKTLLQKEEHIKEKEKELALEKKKQEKQLKNSLLDSFGQLFNLSKSAKLNTKKTKIKKKKNNTNQFSFDLD